MKLSLVDFKKHEFFETDLEGDVCISGKNGEGKTAILEGLLFAMFGRSFWNKVGVDVLIREGAKCATATLNIDDLEIKRTIGKENAVYLNGVESKVSDVAALYPPLDVVYPAINPLYWIYEMSDIEKRALFAKLLPRLDREDIFKKHYSTREDLIAKFNSYTLKTIREQIKAFKTMLIADQSAIDTAKLDIQTKTSQIQELRVDSQMPAGVLEREKDVQRQIEEKQTEITNMGNPQARIDEYKAELEEYAKQAKPIIEKLHAKNLSNATEMLAEYITKLEDVIGKAEHRSAELQMLIKQMEQFRTGVCPTCGQNVDKSIDRTDEYLTEYKKLQEQLVSYNTKYSSIQEIKDTVDDIAVNAVRCSNGIKIHENKISKFNSLTKKIEELQSELKGANQEDFAKAVDIENRRAQVGMLQNDITNKKNMIARLEENDKKIENDLPDLELLEQALSNAGVDAWIAREQAEMIKKELSEFVDVDIQTALVNKTNDNLKEVFEITKNGVSFRSMSYGEKIKIAIAFGLVIRRLAKNFNVPFVVIDEASTLSTDTLTVIKDWLSKDGINLIYTKATNTKLTIKAE